MQSRFFSNVFALGDAGSSPNSKTGAAVRKQAPVLLENYLATIKGTPPKASYDGSASCPLVTGYGKSMLADFDYDGNPTPSVPFIDTTKERWSMSMLMMRGRA